MKFQAIPKTRQEWRRLFVLAVVVVVPCIGYGLWSPGGVVTDGRHDRGENGLWLAHGWLGADEWFATNNKLAEVPKYRDPQAIRSLRLRVEGASIKDLYPHLCPTDGRGDLPRVDDAQTERFLDAMADRRVLPWVGGVLEVHCHPGRAEWRTGFIDSVMKLLNRHPRLAGIHLNVEPWPDGDKRMLVLLEELRAAMPKGKTLSVATYPPPTRWQPAPDIHWGEAYFREVARRCDQLAVMMYDTSIRFQKPYQLLMSQWTREVLSWSEGKAVLLGLPAYDDAGVGYHDPRVENLRNGLRGIHAGLLGFEHLPVHYQGVAIYSDWEMDDSEWALLRAEFLKLQ